MGADLASIHRALADQIRDGIARDWNVAAFPFSGMPLPLIEVWPGGDYLNYFSTFGGDGLSDLMLAVRVETSTADAETTFTQITDMLSVGTGHTSSVPDAVMADTTLSGTVQVATVLTAEWDPSDENLGRIAVIPVRITLKKSGANV